MAIQRTILAGFAVILLSAANVSAQSEQTEDAPQRSDGSMMQSQGHMQGGQGDMTPGQHTGRGMPSGKQPHAMPSMMMMHHGQTGMAGPYHGMGRNTTLSLKMSGDDWAVDFRCGASMSECLEAFEQVRKTMNNMPSD